MSSIWDGVASLFSGVNSVKGKETEEEGVLDPVLPELELSMDDDELRALKSKWQTAWAKKEPGLRGKQNKNERFWLGIQHDAIDQNKSTDNLIFESLESFLPAATQRNPEPVVTSENSDIGKKIADNWSKLLVRLGDELRIKLRVKRLVRHWALYYIGMGKIGWSEQEDDITVDIIRPQKLVLDPNGTITSDGQYDGEFIGELRTDTARNLTLRFPKKKAEITAKVNGETGLGTDCNYYEWWTDEFVFWSFEEIILDKRRNPHWNYDGEKQNQTMDEYGQMTTEKVPVPGINHFTHKKKPYVPLSIFNVGKNPFDDTGLIEQNISLQEMVNQRIEQISRNAQKTNSGLVVSGSVFTREQAAIAARELENGNALWVPEGDVRAAYARDTAPPLPNFVYESLRDYRQELRGIFGTTGIVPQGIKNESTVRGKIIVRGQDTDRIGGGISEFIEQWVDETYNWFVQMMLVYYEPKNYARALGQEGGNEMAMMVLAAPPSQVSVKEGSLIPRDPVTMRNEAMDLWAAQAIDPITLFDRLEFPNPRESAKQLMIWRMVSQGALPPTVMFPDFPMPPPMMAPPPGGPPGPHGVAPGGPPGQPPPSQSALSQVPIQ